MAVGRYQHAHAASTYSYILALSRPFSRRRRPRRRRLSFLFTFLPQLSRPFTVILSFSVLFPVLLSLSLFSQPLTPITTFLSVFLTLPISLYASFSLSLSSPISPINIGYLSVFLFLISARRLLCLFLLKLHPHPASSALLPATGFYYLRTLYGATAIIFTAVMVFTRLFRKKESRSIRIVLSPSPPP